MNRSGSFRRSLSSTSMQQAAASANKSINSVNNNNNQQNINNHTNDYEDVDEEIEDQIDSARNIEDDFDASNQQEHITVVVRVRPPLPREIKAAQERGEPYVSTIKINDSHKSLTISDALDNDYGVGHSFTFDHVYGEDSRQDEIYENHARGAVLSVLKGYNATLFAYGQTGTGKTFTMEGFSGKRELRGVIPRATEDIFDYIETKGSSNINFLIRASYLQIYKEVIYDLLDPSKSNLTIREDKKKGTCVEGLTEVVVRTPKEIYQLIERGRKGRAKAATKLNEESSRSHAVFIIVAEHLERSVSNEEDIDCANADAITGKQGTHEVKESYRIGKLNLVDLAGSERVSVSGASGDLLEQTKKINLSLTCLGMVISALTKTYKKKEVYVPYRDSKLTRLLADSLGGNCRTTMLAMVSPALEFYGESLSTLNFAKRAKCIKNVVTVNEDLDQRALLRKYEKELKRLRIELSKKNKTVVGKQRILELEEEKRRAEEDKLAAIEALEARSREFLHEKTLKRKLEEKIAHLQSQLLVGGEKIEETPAFRKLIKQEYERVHKQYEKKLAELERERQSIEEDKAQVDRYKQLLLKQRDIMIALTARLNERDETILSLQEELDAYDHHQKMLEDALDRKTAALIHLQRVTDAGLSTKEKEKQALRKIIEVKMIPYMNTIYKSMNAFETPEMEETTKQVKKQVATVTQLMKQTANALSLNSGNSTEEQSSTSEASLNQFQTHE
ncbi:hypothetical protein C9374_010954 [Naegleria lovaniensis]|uniref:Kinesin-like protein n=1 Tax=Naegleria lovaniensis TaxID=51637 RepID=A0AA88GGX7_NAELO|nr:uncharacterized protein C9374_010954 [Naegleria lovaniensis]KAG2374384.1 hypothetical protein C9374_010954 [Naegleria lovaniensis]